MAAIGFPAGGIDDGVVRLRLHAAADIPWIAEACRDPDIPRWTGVPDDYGPEDAKIFVHSADQRQADGTGLNLIVVNASDGQPLGSVGIVSLEPGEARCELGYWLAKEARGHGYAARSVRLLSGWIFASLALERIAIHAEPSNGRSRAVAERAGFREEGILRSYFVQKGRRHDAASYSLLRDDMAQGA